MMVSRALRMTFSPLGKLIRRLPGWVFTRTSQMAIDAGLAWISVAVAFQLRFDAVIPLWQRPMLWNLLLLLPILRPLSIGVFGGHRSVWRYFASHDELTLVTAAVAPTALLVFLRYTLPTDFLISHVSGGVILIEFGVFLLLATGVRYFRRATYEAVSRPGHRTRAVVVGTAETLASALRHLDGYSNVQVVGLLATEEYLQGLVIGGSRVIGTPDQLSNVLSRNEVDLVLVSDAGLDCVGSVVETATQFGLDIRLLPSAANVLQGEVRISALVDAGRAVARQTGAEPVHEAVVNAFRDRTVLVTGAGGSIGSELCRQISRLPIATLVLLDRDENSIFEISGELSAAAGNRIVPLVGDIRDHFALRQLFEHHRPHIVLHAAAYKHVPVMEQNCSEAVLNNVVGTRQVAELAVEFKAERFLMISTDKAVRPTSIMGATKRVAEEIVQLVNLSQPVSTRCCCVRFGNVVGSRGSVVPIFLKQIANGGPITITDEAMTRFLMTIPEAVQLVLQASTLVSEGNIYMLEMGDPVKITAIARKLIEMSGLRPDKDIALKVVGIRPGEKLHEQLWNDSAEVCPTEFPRVLALRKSPADPHDFYPKLKQLEEAARLRDEVLVRQCIREMPIEFQAEPTYVRVARSAE